MPLKSPNSSTNSQPSPKIREGTFAIAFHAIKLFQHSGKQKSRVGWMLGRQFFRAACSVGASVKEARSAESRSDFIHKLDIVQREGAEVET